MDYEGTLVKKSLTDENLIFLNKLRKEEPEKYKRKLRILGIEDSDVPYRSATEINNSSDSNISKDEKESYHSFDPYKYSWEWNDEDKAASYYSDDSYEYDDFEKSVEPVVHNKDIPEINTLYLVDGDNIITEVLLHLHQCKNDEIYIFVSQKELYDRVFLYQSRNVNAVKVEPGNQAVDNRIKSFLGRAVRNNIYNRIIIVSKDKGYDVLIKKYRKSFGLSNKELARQESLIY